jgi:DNA polymerase III alpha subunit
LRKESAEAIVAARERDGRFRSTEDFALRVPSLNRKELTILARVGALNSIDGVAHRGDALWQVERAGKLEGPLFRQRNEWLQEDAQSQPLQQMNVEERLAADYGGTGLTIGKHPMYYRRQAMAKLPALTEERVRKESDLAGKLAAFISIRIAFWNEQQQLYRIILSINRQEQHRKHSIAWQKEVVLYLQSMFADAAKAGEIPDQDFLAAAWTTIDAIRGVNERRAYFEVR